MFDTTANRYLPASLSSAGSTSGYSFISGFASLCQLRVRVRRQQPAAAQAIRLVIQKRATPAASTTAVSSALP
jgi:hypothetical protein